MVGVRMLTRASKCLGLYWILSAEIMCPQNFASFTKSADLCAWTLSPCSLHTERNFLIESIAVQTLKRHATENHPATEAALTLALVLLVELLFENDSRHLCFLAGDV